MKREIKVGDRVKCFEPKGPMIGIVETIDRDGNIEVNHMSGGVICWHPYSVRRLRKKERSVRVTRKMLASAFGLVDAEYNNQGHVLVPRRNPEGSPWFSRVCNELGLGEE